VLLFGQSAGAMNTFVIASLPKAKSLINATISESGGGKEVEINSTAHKLGAAYVKSLNCGISDVSESSIFAHREII
jgi:carboxylesterase type B